MSNKQKLILTIKDLQALQNADYNVQNLSEMTLTVISGGISSIKVLSKSVLLIKFETGEIRLDITSDDLLMLEHME